MIFTTLWSRVSSSYSKDKEPEALQATYLSLSNVTSECKNQDWTQVLPPGHVLFSKRRKHELDLKQKDYGISQTGRAADAPMRNILVSVTESRISPGWVKEKCLASVTKGMIAADRAGFGGANKVTRTISLSPPHFLELAPLSRNIFSHGRKMAHTAIVLPLSQLWQQQERAQVQCPEVLAKS